MTHARRSIDIPGFGHGTRPIPAASRIGPLLMTGGVDGIDRATRTLPDTAEAQVRNMFDNLAAILAAGGATPEDLVKVDVQVTAREVRDLLDQAWLVFFPDPASRPARHTRTAADLPKGRLVQCEATAFIFRDAPDASP